MASILFIPEEVKEAIRGHVRQAVSRAREGYLSAEEDEDTLTGHLGGLLRIGVQTVQVPQGEIAGEWKWSLSYYKFRGRGAAAPESFVGADGILELTLDRGFRKEQKSLLFQAKKRWDVDHNLFAQSVKMSTWREASFVLNFTPDAFEAYRLDDVIRVRGRRGPDVTAQPLSDFIGCDFADCKIGNSDLFYDGKAKKLIWRDFQGEIVAASFMVSHRISILVESPGPDNRIKADKEIPLKDAHLHRMHATAWDVLSLPSSATEKEIKDAHRRIALAYHPDKLSQYDTLLSEISGRRMQEANDAKEDLLRTRSIKKQR